MRISARCELRRIHLVSRGVSMIEVACTSEWIKCFQLVDDGGLYVTLHDGKMYWYGFLTREDAAKLMDVVSDGGSVGTFIREVVIPSYKCTRVF